MRLQSQIQVTILLSKIKHFYRSNGGALFLKESLRNSLIESTDFFDNKAENNGGAIHIEFSHELPVSILIKNASFVRCQAK